MSNIETIDSTITSSKKENINELFKLNVSQFLAFVFFAGTLVYEILMTFKFSNKFGGDLFFEKYSKPIILIGIVFFNGSRIFLASWETEEDPMHAKIIELSPLQKRKDWLIRCYWLFAVYLLPFLIHSENSSILIWVMPIYWIILYSLLWHWDNIILNLIDEKRELLTKHSESVLQQSREYFPIDATRPSFGKVNDSAFEKITCPNGTIKKKLRLKNFEEKTILWRKIDFICFICLLIYSFLSILSNFIIKDGVYSNLFLWLLAFVIIGAFAIEFRFNQRDYLPRFKLCLIATGVVTMLIYAISLIPKTKSINNITQKQYFVDTAKNELLFSDSELEKLSTKKNLSAALAVYLIKDTNITSNYNIPFEGDNIINYLSIHQDSTIKITWKPLKADVSLSGDIGYTCGIYYIANVDSIKSGNYCTKWQRDKNKKWKISNSP